MDALPIYRRLAEHYRAAVESGALGVGQRFPSMRVLMARHGVSLSTAVQVCRQLESDGWLEARPRSGNFVRLPRRSSVPALREPAANQVLDPAQFVGINARVSEFIARGHQAPIKVNLSGARAAPELYPAEALKNLATSLLRRHPEVLVKAPHPRGNPALRSVLANRATESGMALSPEDILVTHGCIEALNLALRAATEPGDIVAVESPTFYGLLQILETLNLRALEIPTSPQTGLSIEALELALQTGQQIKALVVVPHLQNPLGCHMPDAHKARLVDLCVKQGITLIEDDSYSVLSEEGVSLRSLKSWAPEHVIHCASLHKVLAPGMRLGWIAAGRLQSRVKMLKYIHSRNNEELGQRTAAAFIETAAYDRHLVRLRASLRSQRLQTAEVIASVFPEGTRLNAPRGGLSLWVALPGGVSSQALFDLALAEGIFMAPGLMFSNSNRFDGFARINCGAPYTAEIEAALKRLGALCGSLSA